MSMTAAAMRVRAVPLLLAAALQLLHLHQTAAGGQLSVAPIFSDSMILQRLAPTKVFGRNATANAAISVAVFDSGGAHLGSGSGRADANGSWVAELAAPFVPASPSTRVVVSEGGGGSSLTLRDVAWGDVVLCGGQRCGPARAKARFPMAHLRARAAGARRAPTFGVAVAVAWHSACATTCFPRSAHLSFSRAATWALACAGRRART